jgi:hypothetical protein
MNEEQDPVETLLARMKPAEMSNDLMARLTAVRSKIAPAPKSRFEFFTRFFIPAATVACVAVLTVKFLDGGVQKPTNALAAAAPTPSQNTMPVVVQDNMLQAREMGVMVGPNRQPYRVMEYQWVESEIIMPGANVPPVRLETTRRQIVPVQIEVY